MLSMQRCAIAGACSLLRDARREVQPLPRAALLRARIAEREGAAMAVRLLRIALRDSPQLLQEELPRLLKLAGAQERDAVLGELVEQAQSHGFDELKRLFLTAIAAELVDAPTLRRSIDRVFFRTTPRCGPCGAPDRINTRGSRTRSERSSRRLRSIAESECGFSERSFYWHCPACHA